MTFIYVINCPAMGAMKIGISAHPHGRLRELQTGCPFPLKLMALSQVPKDKAGATEAYAHRKLRKYRIHGEWFRVRPAVLRWLMNSPMAHYEEGASLYCCTATAKRCRGRQCFTPEQRRQWRDVNRRRALGLLSEGEVHALRVDIGPGRGWWTDPERWQKYVEFRTNPPGDGLSYEITDLSHLSRLQVPGKAVAS